MDESRFHRRAPVRREVRRHRLKDLLFVPVAVLTNESLHRIADNLIDLLQPLDLKIELLLVFLVRHEAGLATGVESGDVVGAAAAPEFQVPVLAGGGIPAISSSA